jgi:hypothetical protein
MAAKKGDRSILYVRGLPKGLLGRINARAEELDLDRDEFVADLLMRVLKRFEKPQEETRDWWKKLGDDADQQ